MVMMGMKLNVKQKATQQAFTLVEMVVVLVIVGVLTVIGYPYFMEWLYASEARRVEQLFVQALRQARAQSHISRKDVVICTLDESGRCGRGANQTLMLFYDINHNNQKDEMDKVIYQSHWRVKYGQMVLNTSLSRDYIRYMGDTAKPRGHIGHLRYCSVSKNKRLSFKVIVNMYGNVRVEREEVVGVRC